MPKQIITTRTVAQGGILTLQTVFWYPVPVGREVPKPDLQNSAYRGATQPELDALKAGTVLEEVEAIRLPKSFTAVQLKAALLAWWTDRKAFLDANPPEGQYYGVFYDGGWSA